MARLASLNMTSLPSRGAARVAQYFWPIATALLVIRFYVDSKCNLVPDEAFYWTWTRHLATGYFDHPPMIAWLIWLTTHIFGNTELGVRIGASTMSIASLAVLFQMARQILPDARSVGYVILMWIAGPLLPVIGTIITPDAPATFFSVCALAVAVRLAARDERAEPRNWKVEFGLWHAFGALCGLAFLSKYTTVLVPAGVVLAFVTSRKGIRNFARPWIYLAGIVSLLVFSPCIDWNYQHHWASFAFQLNHGAGGGLTEGVNGSLNRVLARTGGLAQFVGGQAIVWTPILFGIALIVVLCNWWMVICTIFARLSNRPAADMPTSSFAKLGKLNHLTQVDWLLLCSGSLPLLFFGVMSTRSHGEINWPAFAYFPLSLLVARFLSENWNGIRVQWTRIGCQVALGFVIVMHLLTIPSFQQLLLRRHVHLTHQITDLWGWNEFGRQLQLQSLGMTVICNRHQDAGEAAFYMPGQPDIWCDGVGSRTTAFDFFDRGQPDYAQIPEVAFIGGHADLFKKKHVYPRTREITEVIMPGLGKNRSHTVTIVGR